MHKKKSVLRVFFVVTKTSLYAIEYGDVKDGILCMTKLAQRDGLVSKRPVGRRIEGWDSPFFVIRRDCLQLCNGWEDEHHHADYTTYPIAFFINEAEALACLREPGGERFDRRWREQTCQVLAQIGNSHPFFRVSWDDLPPEFDLR